MTEVFKMNSRDFSQYVNKYGPSPKYDPIQGLPSKYTMDGTLHDDVIGNKATYTIPLNPVTPAVAKEILAEYRVKELFVTVKDIADDAAITVLCKPGSVSGVVGLVQQGAVTLWQLSPLIFQQKK